MKYEPHVICLSICSILMHIVKSCDMSRNSQVCCHTYDKNKPHNDFLFFTLFHPQTSGSFLHVQRSNRGAPGAHIKRETCGKGHGRHGATCCWQTAAQAAATSAMPGLSVWILRWAMTYQEQLQQQHQQKQQALEPRGLTWPGWSCWAGAVPPAADSCCTDICLFRISIRSDPMGCRQRRVIEFSL